MSSSRAYRPFLCLLILLCLGCLSWGAITLYAPEAGDASYAWNSKYGSYGYTTGASQLGVSFYLGGSYGNDYGISIFEIPIASLAGKEITSAVLEVESLGFDTSYYYGSAGIRWVNTGTMTLTGDVVADNLGPAAASISIEYYLFNSGSVDGSAGLKQFDVLNHLLDDLAAGRAYMSFVLCGSRETSGSIYAAESGSGPRLVVVPEPMSLLLLAVGGLAAGKKRR